MSSEREGRNRRPFVAWSVRILVTLGPIALSVLVVLAAGRVWTRPEGLALTMMWWIGLTAIATLMLWAADWWFRKLLPVVALFRLSLVFPDKAPSRFKMALRHGTVRQLQRDLAADNLSTAAPGEAAEQLIELAAGLNAHDRMTRGHTERVRAYSVIIGEELGLSETDLEMLNWSGLVHDIGKLAVPAEILNKPGKPDDAEWAILRGHPAEADRLIEPLRGWLGEWAESATLHHERFDGAGYPNGISGTDITLAGRIVAVADAYDVMTSTRSYKSPMPADLARKELADNAGSQFDPDIVRAFLGVSIGRLRLVMGPLSSLVQMPFGGASLGSAVVTGSGAAASLVLAAGIGIGAVAPVEIQPEQLAMIDGWQLETLEDTPLTFNIASGQDDAITSASIVGITPATGLVSIEDETLVYTPPPGTSTAMPTCLIRSASAPTGARPWRWTSLSPP
jgi:hypothetical protein